MKLQGGHTSPPCREKRAHPVRLPLDCLGSQFGHGLCVALKTELPDLRYARSTIGFEYQPEYSGHEVVEFLASVGIGKFRTLGTAICLLFHTARAHLAPGCLCVLVTSIAFLIQVGLAGSAIKPAISDKPGIHLDLRHVHLLSEILPKTAGAQRGNRLPL
jgi:hypothetical protein